MLELLSQGSPIREEIQRLADSSAGYLHWSEFRYKQPFPAEISREEGWALVRMSRLAFSKQLPFTSKAGNHISIALTDGLHAAVRRIGARRSLLDAGVPERPHTDLPENMQTFGLKALIDEAYYSAVIEGAVSTRKDAQRMIREETVPRDHSERMILNNYLAGRKMAEQWVKQAMTPELLCEIQKTLTRDTLEDPADWGQFRTGPIEVVDEAQQETVHTGPEAGELPERIEKLCAYANYENPDDPVPVLVRACVLHYQLAYDHPFGDGNGRTARWLFLWRLLRCPEYWWIAMLSISRMTNQGKTEYYNSFRYAESDQFDATYLVRQQLDSLEKEMQRFAKFLTRRRDLALHIRKFIPHGEEPGSRQVALLEHAMRRDKPVYTQPVHSAFHEVSQPTARKDLEELVAWGLLQRKTGRPVLYSGTELLAQAARAYRAEHTGN
jgi:Fic family protein